jgi:hypothetical protein
VDNNQISRKGYSEGDTMATVRRFSTEQREQMIAEAAYYRAEGRGFADGDPFLDWLDAEREIDALLNVPKAESWLKQLESQLSTGRDQASTLKQENRQRRKDRHERN